MVEINYECIKDILLYLKDYLGYKPDTHNRLRIDWKEVYNNEDLLSIYDDPDIIRYNLEKMYEAGFISLSGYNKLPKGRVNIFIIEDITIKGYELLDYTQNNSAWKEIKTKLKSYGGEGYKFLSAIGIQVVAAEIKSRLGI